MLFHKDQGRRRCSEEWTRSMAEDIFSIETGFVNLFIPSIWGTPRSPLSSNSLIFSNFDRWQPPRLNRAFCETHDHPYTLFLGRSSKGGVSHSPSSSFCRQIGSTSFASTGSQSRREANQRTDNKMLLSHSKNRP